MGKASQIKTSDNDSAMDPVSARFGKQDRLNLNDLLARREKEEQLDKKTNRLIFAGVFSLAAVIVLILSF